MSEGKTLSNETIKVLKNYAQINQCISVQPGDTLRTISNSNVILGRAKVNETFDTPFAIYDLSEFLSAVELFDSPELFFGEKSVIIKEKDSEKSINYRYADPSIIHTTNKNITMPECEVQFNLPEKEFSRMLKTAAVLGAPHIVVTNTDDINKARVSVTDCDNPASHNYHIEVDLLVPCDKKFNLIFKVDNLIVLPKDYKILISSRLLSNFNCAADNLDYWIALETVSAYGE